MKRVTALRSIAFLITFAMAATLVSCSAEQPGAAEGVVRVGMVFDVGGKGDKSFNDSAYRGLLHAADQFDVEHTEFEPGQDADRETGLRKLAQARYDVIIGVGFLFSDAMRKVAADYPDVMFACVDFDARPDEVLPYVAGAKHANPAVSVTVAYAGTTPQAFADPAKGKELALLQFGRGVDVIYHAAGSTGNGVIEAAREVNRQAIGVDSNQNYMAPGNVLTSMVKRVDNAVFMIVKSIVDGEFQGGLREFGLADDGISYAVDEYNESLLTEDMLAAVEAARQSIIDGVVSVPTE